MKVTKEQFEKSVKEFFEWANPDDKTKTTWLLGLEKWARWQYAVAYAEEQEVATS